MNLDDYDKIPCSAKEARAWMNQGNFCTTENHSELFHRLSRVRNEIEWSVDGDGWRYKESGTLLCNWFKLVPKSERCSQCGTWLRAEKQNCSYCDKPTAKPDRFAAIETLIDLNNFIFTDPKHFEKSIQWFFKQFARAIVELVEKEK